MFRQVRYPWASIGRASSTLVIAATVALLVLSLGVMAAAALQGRALHGTDGALRTTQALYLAQALLEYETLSGEEIKDLLEKGVAPNRDENNFPNAGPSVAVPVTPVSDGTEIAVPVAKPAATSVPTVH